MHSMAKIVMFGNQKGGVGKTAATVMAATALSQAPHNFKTCIIDLDNQKSAARARAYDLRAYGIEADKAPYKIEAYTIAELQENIAKLDQAHDLIFWTLPAS